jgi:tetratricopeptide (TPR) repeat protein
MASSREPSLVGAGVGLEAVAVIAAHDGMAAFALAAHLAGCCAIALGLSRRLPPGATGLALAMAAFLPILGALGSFAVAWVRPAATVRRRSTHVHTRIPGPEAARLHACRPRPPRAGAPTAARVMAAQGRDDRGAIALLRRTLADRDEDARLVAHAVLESKQRSAHRRLQDAARALEAAPPERRALLERRLAAEHWELARTALADGECRVHALDSARDHARAAAAMDPSSAPLALLVARIALACGRPAEAEAALARAVELGLPPAIAAPYLAEAAFAARRFDRVRPRLAVAPRGNPAVDRIRRFWS